ncbi:MAG: carboxypeptidase regulatory-like domain-containing protein [Chloroflexi bacterium]|nr:carboxypeptidase regulatory-like domain-containing protein [Chloroflexota bacterium]
MISTRSVAVSAWILFAIGTLLLFLLGCGSNAGAEQPPTEPTMGIEPGVAPGQATPTRNTTPRATLIPGDPNQPVSNKTPVTTENQNAARATISGRVTNAQNEPIARARLAFTKSSVPMPEIAYFTDATGNYKLTVPPGQFTLAVFADGYASQERQVDTRQESQKNVDFVLQTQP